MKALFVAAKVAAPVLLVSLAVGFVISLFQSVTQLQEATLTFVPKLAAAGLNLLVAGGWMLRELMGLTHALFDMLPRLLGSG